METSSHYSIVTDHHKSSNGLKMLLHGNVFNFIFTFIFYFYLTTSMLKKIIEIKLTSATKSTSLFITTRYLSENIDFILLIYVCKTGGKATCPRQHLWGFRDQNPGFLLLCQKLLLLFYTQFYNHTFSSPILVNTSLLLNTQSYFLIICMSLSQIK